MIRNGVTEIVPGYMTNAISDDALAYIDNHAEDENPFYLSIHYTQHRTHRGLVTPKTL